MRHIIILITFSAFKFESGRAAKLYLIKRGLQLQFRSTVKKTKASPLKTLNPFFQNINVSSIHHHHHDHHQKVSSKESHTSHSPKIGYTVSSSQKAFRNKSHTSHGYTVYLHSQIVYTFFPFTESRWALCPGLRLRRRALPSYAGIQVPLNPREKPWRCSTPPLLHGAL